MVPDEEIQRILAMPSDLSTKTSDLIDEANENGGKDNIAVILVKPDVDEV